MYLAKKTRVEALAEGEEIDEKERILRGEIKIAIEKVKDSMNNLGIDAKKGNGYFRD